LLIQRPVSRSAPVQFGQTGIVIAASDKRFPGMLEKRCAAKRKMHGPVQKLCFLFSESTGKGKKGNVDV
jgi:hypothetical protein